MALEALGLSGLFLTLFFAYYNGVIASLAIVSLCFVVVMAVTLWLSLKQQSIELALMAMIIAYLAPFTLPVTECHCDRAGGLLFGHQYCGRGFKHVQAVESPQSNCFFNDGGRRRRLCLLSG